jgi:hypothetical protein
MRNRGVDLNLNWTDKALGGQLRYSVGVNITHYKNEVLKLNNDPNATLFGFTTRIPSITATRRGYPIASFYGFYADGILNAAQAASAPKFGSYTREGTFNFRDVNKDGVVTAADRDFLGNPHPDFIYGINLSAGYKNFDLAIFAKQHTRATQNPNLTVRIHHSVNSRWVNTHHTVQHNRLRIGLAELQSCTNRHIEPVPL